jgi:hypothetical protein
MKILEFTNLSGESSAQLTERRPIVCVFVEPELIDKAASFSVDNTNANFGGARRRGNDHKCNKNRHHWHGLHSTYE